MKMLRVITALALGMVFLTSTSARAFDLQPVVGLNLFSPKHAVNDVASTTYSGKVGVGFGGFINFSLLPGFEVQTGAMYLKNPYSIASAPPLDVSYSVLHVPVMVRFTALPIVSIGAGPYFNFLMGNVSVTNTVTGTTTEFTTAALNRSSNDMGIVVGAAADLPLAPMLKLVADVRYYFGLKDQDDSVVDSFKSGGIMFLAGVKFGF